MYGMSLLIKVELSNDLAFLLAHLLLSTLMHFMLVFLILIVPMLASCDVLMFRRATLFRCVLMFMRWRAEAHLLGRFLLAIPSTARPLWLFFVSLGGLTFVCAFICINLNPSLSIDYALGTYNICVFLCLQVLISRPLDLHSINHFHWDHWYDIVPDFRGFHMLRRSWSPMHYLRGQ